MKIFSRQLLAGATPYNSFQLPLATAVIYRLKVLSILAVIIFGVSSTSNVSAATYYPLMEFIAEPYAAATSDGTTLDMTSIMQYLYLNEDEAQYIGSLGWEINISSTYSSYDGLSGYTFTNGTVKVDGGAILDATFDNMLINVYYSNFLGYYLGGFSADLTYLGGSYAGSLPGGNIHGTLADLSNPDLSSAFTSYQVLGRLEAVSLVPIPAAFWLFGSGLLGLIGFAKRKKA